MHWEEIEEKILSPYAALASKSKGRLHEESDCEIRTCFQRDRDKIIHSNSFRRLKYNQKVITIEQG